MRPQPARDEISDFREAFARVFGEAPGRGRGAECVRLGWIESPLGPLVAGEGDEGLCLLEFTDPRRLETQAEVLRRRLGRPLVPGDGAHLQRLRTELAEYFAGRRRGFGVALHAPGTAFERRVWEALLRIPYGETRSYEGLARELGAPRAARAVGRANGMNRVSILIPCHRLVTKGGELGGYGGGLWRKQALLHLERTGEPIAREAVLGPAPALRPELRGPGPATGAGED